jgi:cytochrome d ubiquinol oxidase subunit I
VIVLGDESGYTVGEAQQTKLAAMEAMWDTEPAPGRLQSRRLAERSGDEERLGAQMPWVMGLIGTRSVTHRMPGIIEIKERTASASCRHRSRRGAGSAAQESEGRGTAKATFEEHKADLGFGLLLKRTYRWMCAQATRDDRERPCTTRCPRVTPLFWSFRLMVGSASLMLALFGLALWHSVKGNFAEQKPWLLRWALWMLPVPWIACELGWFVAEYGRQPWTIYGVLPTHLSVSTLTVSKACMARSPASSASTPCC